MKNAFSIFILFFSCKVQLKKSSFCMKGVILVMKLEFSTYPNTVKASLQGLYLTCAELLATFKGMLIRS